MWALLRKDFILFSHPAYWLSVVFVAIAIGGLTGDIRYGAALISLISVMVIPLTDVRSKAAPFIVSLPISRVDIVKTRYLEVLLFSLIGYGLTAFFAGIGIYVNPYLSIHHANILQFLVVILLFFTFILPFLHKVGGIGIWVLYMIGIAFLVFLVNLWESSLVDIILQQISWLPDLVLLVIMLVCFGLSYKLSCSIYRSRDI